MDSMCSWREHSLLLQVNSSLSGYRIPPKSRIMCKANPGNSQKRSGDSHSTFPLNLKIWYINDKLRKPYASCVRPTPRQVATKRPPSLIFCQLYCPLFHHLSTQKPQRKTRILSFSRKRVTACLLSGSERRRLFSLVGFGFVASFSLLVCVIII